MIARVISKDGREYCSHVFAANMDGFDSTVVVFDAAARKFAQVNMYDISPSLVRKVFIIDGDCSDFVDKEKGVMGYGWLVDNAELLRAIEKGKPVADEYVNKAVELNASIERREWTEVRTDRDVENLFNAAWGFHDAEIESVTVDGDKLTVVFGGCWNSMVELIFEGDIEYRYERGAEYYYEIFSAAVLFSGGYVYWVDDDITDVADIDDELTYFRGRSLKWKQTLDNDKSEG